MDLQQNISQDKIDELLALRVTAREYGEKIAALTQENEQLKREKENTEIILGLCLDALKKHKIELRK